MSQLIPRNDFSILWPMRRYYVNAHTGQVHFRGCAYFPSRHAEWLGWYASIADATQGARLGGHYQADCCDFCCVREQHMEQAGLAGPFFVRFRSSHLSATRILRSVPRRPSFFASLRGRTRIPARREGLAKELDKT